MLVVRLALFTLKPRVRRMGKQLIVSTPLWLTILTLAAYRRVVHVDGEARYIYFHERSFWWFVGSRVVPFKQISRIVYDYFGVPTDADRRGVYDEVERFRVAIQLRGSDEQLELARFYGGGAAAVGAEQDPTGQDLLDVQGTQDLDSRQLVEQLCRLTGAPLGSPAPTVTDAQGRRWHCGQCGREVAPQPKCLYCGGPAAPRES